MRTISGINLSYIAFSMKVGFPELLDGCNDLEVNLSSPFNFSVPLPLFLSSENETIYAACEPSFFTEVGQHEVKCSVDDFTLEFNESCYFNVTIDLEKEISPLTSPETGNICLFLVNFVSLKKKLFLISNVSLYFFCSYKNRIT